MSSKKKNQRQQHRKVRNNSSKSRLSVIVSHEANCIMDRMFSGGDLSPPNLLTLGVCRAILPTMLAHRSMKDHDFQKGDRLFWTDLVYPGDSDIVLTSELLDIGDGSHSYVLVDARSDEVEAEAA